jgi:DNA-damage-inducible protein D
MTDQSNLSTMNAPQSPFERIKQIDENGNEFWSVRDLMPVLNYTLWQNFRVVLLKAQMACENSGYDPDDHFIKRDKMVTIGSGAKRKIEDFHLSRYACYLVVQNADPSKEIVALGQTYFAVQTRRQEVADEQEQLTEDEKRLNRRERIKNQNTELASAAKSAEVITSQDFAVFQNHGYKGLYNGLAAEDIHKKKSLKKSQNILDHMGSLELSANLFRSSAAEDRLRRENIRGKDNANRVHYESGVVVRRAMADLGNPMPENLPAVESIKKLERRAKKKQLPEAKNVSHSTKAVNKTLDYYLSLAYPIEVVPDENADWIAQIPLLPGCTTFGATPVDALEMLDEAKRLWFEEAIANRTPIPEPQKR